MKIAMVLRNLSARGSSRYALETSRYFVQKGHEVHIFANKWDSVEGVKFHKIPIASNNFNFREMSFLLSSSLILKKYKFDVVYSQPGRYFSPTVAGVHILSKPWIKYELENNLTVSAVEKVLSLIESFNLKMAKKTIAISNTIKSNLISYYGVPSEKISVIYNGVNLKEFNTGNRKLYSEEIRKQHNIPKDDILLFFSGNPFLRKGLRYVIEALPRLKNVKLLVLGRDDPTPYQRLSKKLGVEDKVIFLVSLVDKISKYFAASDIFVFPTQYEPFGLVILEAMASGLPVVTTKLAGAAELIEDGKDGLLLDNPKDSKELKTKLNYLINNERIRRQIGRSARKKAEKYTWKKTADEMLKVFEESIKL